MQIDGLQRTLNYGRNRVRYLAPVPAGSRLRGRLGILEAEDVPPNALRVTYKVAIEIEGGQRPACVAEVLACTINEASGLRWQVLADLLRDDVGGVPVGPVGVCRAEALLMRAVSSRRAPHRTGEFRG